MTFKTQLSVLLLSLLALFLVACGGSAEPTADLELEAEVEAEVEAASETAPVVETEAEIVGVVSSTDFDQIGQTGRPAFLNSYADW